MVNTVQELTSPSPPTVVEIKLSEPNEENTEKLSTLELISAYLAYR